MEESVSSQIVSSYDQFIESLSPIKIDQLEESLESCKTIRNEAISFASIVLEMEIASSENLELMQDVVAPENSVQYQKDTLLYYEYLTKMLSKFIGMIHLDIQSIEEGITLAGEEEGILN